MWRHQNKLLITSLENFQQKINLSLHTIEISYVVPSKPPFSYQGNYVFHAKCLDTDLSLAVTQCLRCQDTFCKCQACTKIVMFSSYSFGQQMKTFNVN